MRVIGIDPAPRKGLTVFDGEERRIPVSKAAEFMRSLMAKDDVLVCWDAPLTGPSERSLQGQEGGSPSDFTQRPIEKFFARGATGFRAPSGISVMPYSGCPHWTLTRHLLGLPRVGPWDLNFDELPFRLATSEAERPVRGKWVVEVHPAVAVWLWCREGWDGDGWRYKKQRPVLDAVWAKLVRRLPETLGHLPKPADDDALDARIAFALGSLWLAEAGDVVLLGDLDDGTFLLPDTPGLREAFEGFRPL